MLTLAVFQSAVLSSEMFDTPFGKVPLQRIQCGDRNVIVIGRAADSRARAVAARELGAVHVIGVGRAVALSDAFAIGDWVVPDDALDYTRNTPTTFFEGRGLGYVQQTPPFCQETRTGILRGMGDRAHTAGVVVAGPDRPFALAELRAWRRLGAGVAMRGLAPEWYLCHELELGYAALGWVAWAGGEQAQEEPDWKTVLAAVVAVLPPAHSWQGSNTAARNALGDDWRQWIAPG